MCDICDAGVEDDPIRLQQLLDQLDARYRDLIRRFGWMVMNVEGVPPFAYTVGLWGFGHPELVVFGAGPCCAQPILNHLGEQIRADPEAVRDGDEVSFRGYPLQLFTIPDPGEIVTLANRLYGRSRDDSVPALQVVFTDSAGRWPWEPDCALPPGVEPMPGTHSHDPGSA